MLGSAIVHIAYFWLLLRAYKSADLSIAYPLARATGPLLSVLAAILFLGEAPPPLGILPALWFDRRSVLLWARQDLKVMLIVAVLSPLAYMLVLAAMKMAPLSLVAPAREVSILLGVIAGATLLKEGKLTSRLSAASLMMAGLVLIGAA